MRSWRTNLACVAIALAATPAVADPLECLRPAALFHSVNESILLAVLRVESHLRPATVSRNSNNTVDIGMAGINSRHLSDLARVGVAPADLLEPCKATYVAAWMISKHLYRHGHTWFGYAAYHSTTPYYNHRYQILLANELIRMGVLSGKLQPVPPLRPAEAPR